MFLGIDVGTGKTAAVIVDDGGRPIAVSSRAHGADVPAGAGRAEQDPLALRESVRLAIQDLPKEHLVRVSGIGLTGQMHGVLLLDGRGEPVSRLITWQDGRCLEGGWLEGLVSRTGTALRTGYGCATLAWLAEHGGLAGAASAATVHDWIAACLSGSPRPVTDPTDAASWGLFRASALAWDEEAVRAAGIPRGVLPRVVASGCVVGKVPAEAAGTFGVPEGAAVAVPLGDNPASLVATLTEPQAELALTLGTGGQLSAVLPPRAPLLVEPGETGFEYRPFPGGLFMAVAASLCGGSAWRWLARVVQDWLADLGQPGMPEERVFEIMNRAGAAAAGRLTVVPRFQGERHDPALRGRIEGIALDNFTLGEVARSLADGIAANLRDMLPARLRQSRLRIRGSGNALSRNPLLQSAAERAFGLPLEMADIREEAAVGAAFVAAGRVPGGPRAPAGGPRPSLTGPTEA